jgi:hypothetical protein
MITNKEWERLELLLDTKLEQKLEQKLDEKFGEFAIIMKNAFDEVHYKIDSALERLDRHEYRISRNEDEIHGLKRVIRI